MTCDVCSPPMDGRRKGRLVPILIGGSWVSGIHTLYVEDLVLVQF